MSPLAQRRSEARLAVACGFVAMFACAPITPGDEPPPDAPDAGVPTPEPPTPAPEPEAPPLAPTDLKPLLARPAPRWPPLQTSLPALALEISSSNLSVLESTRDVYVSARLRVDGVSHAIEARYRGRSSRAFPKKSFNLKAAPGQLILGRKHLVLLAMYKDAGYLTEKLFWDLLQACGVMGSTARYVELTLNGRPYGVMLDVEAVDKRFLAARGLDPDSDVYRCGQKACDLRDGPPLSYQEPWSKKTNETSGDGNLWAFLRDLNHTDEARLETWLERSFDVDGFVRWLAADATLSTHTFEDTRSYLLQDAASGRWHFVPWDLNNSFAMYLRANPVDHHARDHRPLLGFTVYDPLSYDVAGRRGLPPTWSVLNTRVVDRPIFLERFASQLSWVLAFRFNSAQIDPRIDAMDALLRRYRGRDPFVPRDHVPYAAAYLKRYVRDRHRMLEHTLPWLRAHGQTALKIDRLGVDSAGRYTAEIVNLTGSSQSLRGHRLTASLTHPAGSSLSGVVPGRGRASIDLARAGVRVDPAHLQLGLFASDGTTAIDALFFGPLGRGEVFGKPSGTESFGAIP
jgi:spore coat protein H